MANPTEAAAPALDAGALWDALLPVSLKEHGIRVIEEFLARAAGGKVEGGTDPHYCGDCQALADEGWGMWCDKHTPNGPIPAPSVPEKPGLTAVCRLCGKSLCSCWSTPTPGPAEGQGGREEAWRALGESLCRECDYPIGEPAPWPECSCRRFHEAFASLRAPSPHPPEKPSEGGKP